MAKEEVFLPIEMGRLEIEPIKIGTPSNDDNPFLIRGNSILKRNAPIKCTCMNNKKSIKHNKSFKRNSSKLLKEPVLKFIHSCCQYGGDGKARVSIGSCPNKSNLLSESTEQRIRSPLQALYLGTLNVRAVIDALDQNETEKIQYPQSFSAPSFKELQTPQSRVQSTSIPTTTNNTERNRGTGPSCSQQALNPQCDITIDELASYFETLVHIPKKMSMMAEMMYI